MHLNSKHEKKPRDLETERKIPALLLLKLNFVLWQKIVSARNKRQGDLSQDEEANKQIKKDDKSSNKHYKIFKPLIV